MSLRLLNYLESSVSFLFMARQSPNKRRREDALQDSLQDSPRVKRTKMDDPQNDQLQTSPPTLATPPPRHCCPDYLAVAGQRSPDPTQRAALSSPPSPPPTSEVSPPAIDQETVAPAPLGAPPHPELTADRLREWDMISSSRRSQHRRRSKPAADSLSEVSGHTKDTTVSDSAKSEDRSSAYSTSFPQVLEDYGICADGDPVLLANVQELVQEREIRPSLAPSEYSDGQVEYDLEENNNAVTELDTERGFVPAIVGRCRLPHTGNVSWNNMSSMTDDQTVAPQPDLYYGFRVSDIDKSIRNDIDSLIIPSKTKGAPGAPYMILENKGRHGSLEVVKYQATHGGAATARAQFALKNFGLADPIYDDEVLAEAWTYSCSPGDLTRYVVRVSKPAAGSSQPGYHLTHIKTYHITESIDQFRKGVSAFRHCRSEAHAKALARLEKAQERLRRRKGPPSHRGTASIPAPDETCLAGSLPPLPEAQQGGDDRDSLASHYPRSPLPTLIPGVDQATDELEDSAYQSLADEQLRDDVKTSSQQGVSFSSTVVETSATFESAYGAAPPNHDDPTYGSMFRPRRSKRLSNGYSRENGLVPRPAGGWRGGPVVGEMS